MRATGPHGAEPSSEQLPAGHQEAKEKSKSRKGFLSPGPAQCVEEGRPPSTK